MKVKKILITTPDYLPQLGGLTTFTLNIKNVFEDIGVQVEMLHWKSLREIKSYQKKDVDLIVKYGLWGRINFPV